MAYQPVTTPEYLRHRSPRRGSVILMDVLLFLFHTDKITNAGIYNRRKVRGGSSWSLHSVGRALDIGIPTKEAGDRIFLFLIRAATLAGICELIWWNQRWTAENGVRPYNPGKGGDDHRTHMHIGQTREMADNKASRDSLIAWYSHAIVQ